ncbi:zinc finger CCCH domain-containing 17 [Olea europaea subsp. europaea]|uniref:Zinc finger CCCH domain-containing 17 n=1 Tax=Olea europaea subsp. europaea TaxID=158383 RepID=A0A8S0PPV7_OLEEU|nr:zinc finger CCCH domain-containing 17 [Olea europaea subsp. europaea]
MVGPPPQIESAAAPPPPQTATASAEEEAIKRNTDCVYFLASPLTCKKGSECEYRHSDIARVNPRDCWFWLHGNCLNPKCGFRHPPLDGLLGTQAPTSAPSVVPPLQTASAPSPHVPNASGKQGVPCIFFQKGYCLKGDWCPFLHAPNSVSNKNTLAPGISTAELASFKNTFGGPEKFTQEKKVPSKTLEKSGELPLHTKPIIKVEPAPLRNEFAVGKKTLATLEMNEEFSSYRPRSMSPANNGKQASRTISVQQSHPLDELGGMNSKDAEEISREPSPGFDVLVDDEVRDSDYYPGEDQYGMTGDDESGNEYGIGHSVDYNSMVDVDRDIYHDPHGYDSYEHLQGQYAWEQHKASSERMSGGSAYQNRRHARVSSPDQVSDADLRHHLSKHRRGNGLRSVISQEHARDRHEDQGYKVSSMDAQYLHPQESSLSSRLRGRIKLPGRSLPLDGRDSQVDREIIRGPDHGRSSFGRTQQFSHHGRTGDRVKGKEEEDFNNSQKNNRGVNFRREMKGDNITDFAGPKSLAELKSKKNGETSEQQSLGKRKYSMLDDYQQTGGDLPFEGPKPLEEILKQKRGEIASSGNYRDNNQKEEGSRKMTKITSTVEDQRALSSAPVNEDSKSASHDNDGAEKYGLSDARKLDGMIVEDQLDDQEHEAYEQRDGVSDYEQVDGEYYDDLDEGENGEAEDEYPDDEDGDEFAKKMGVMYS